MPVMFPNLAAEIARRGIKKNVIAEAAGICQRSLNNKLSGKVPFTWPEVVSIRTRFFPDMDLDYLFYSPTGGQSSRAEEAGGSVGG